MDEYDYYFKLGKFETHKKFIVTAIVAAVITMAVVGFISVIEAIIK